ncbi:hypothetical protein CCACVL1_12371, partial [Corchorus capsularis]
SKLKMKFKALFESMHCKEEEYLLMT